MNVAKCILLWSSLFFLGPQVVTRLYSILWKLDSYYSSVAEKHCSSVAEKQGKCCSAGAAVTIPPLLRLQVWGQPGDNVLKQ